MMEYYCKPTMILYSNSNNNLKIKFLLKIIEDILNIFLSNYTTYIVNIKGNILKFILILNNFLYIVLIAKVNIYIIVICYIYSFIYLDLFKLYIMIF